MDIVEIRATIFDKLGDHVPIARMDELARWISIGEVPAPAAPATTPVPLIRFRPVDPLPAAVHVEGHPQRKLGMKLPKRSTSLMRFSSLKIRFALEVKEPIVFDYTKNLPDNLGALMNDSLGDCAFAGPYHRLQAVTFWATGKLLSGDTLADLALRFYEEAGGYNPLAPLGADGENSTDQGGMPDDIARYLIETGMLRPDGTRDKFVAAFDVDVSNEADLAFCAQECFGIGFGVLMTDVIMPPDGSPPPKLWKAGGNPVGGHYIYSLARAECGAWKVNSWGEWFDLDPSFIGNNLVTATAYVSEDALKDGKTVMGLSLSDWLDVAREHAQAIAA